MIAYINGKIISKSDGRVVVAAAQIGYEINITPHTFSQLPPAGESVEMHLSEAGGMYAAPALYGFLNEEEKSLFEIFKSMPRTGAKKALEYMNKAQKSLPDFAAAVAKKDLALLAGIFGFSRKTADNLVSQLKDKIQTLSLSGGAKISGPGIGMADRNRLLEALSSLGFKPMESKKALETTLSQLRGGEKTEDILRQALKNLSPG